MVARTQSSSTTPKLRLRHSLAARITGLVVAVLIATGISSLYILQQLRAQKASFDLLTGVYIPFNARLTAAHLQAARIATWLSLMSEQGTEMQRMSPADEVKLADALAERMRLVARARELLDDALAHADRFGGLGQLKELERLKLEIDRLEATIADVDENPSASVIADVRKQNEINQLVKTLEDHAQFAVLSLQDEVRKATRRTESLALGLTFAVSILALLATLAVIWTLRPLHLLISSVRQLGRGDWDQRIDLQKDHRAPSDEVRQLAYEFNLMAEALQAREQQLIRGERLAAVGQLAAQVTHEIRNPLSSVALNVELLEDEIHEASPEAVRLLQRITTEVDRLTQITEEYLGFARRQKPELELINIIAEVNDLLDFLAEEHEQAGIAIIRQLAAGPLWVLGDSRQLRQALLNLLRNAREVLSPQVFKDSLQVGSEDIAKNAQITIHVHKAEQMIHLAIHDNGPGLTTEPADRIFEPFFSHKAHGTGLGLTIVQQIVQDHGGSIQVRSTPWQDTCFEIVLPACDLEQASVS